MDNLKSKRLEIEQALIEKATKDKLFRKELVQNPVETIEKETGIKIPPSVKLTVLEETGGNYYLVIPALPTETSDGELTEEDLKKVSGGDGEGWETFYSQAVPCF